MKTYTYEVLKKGGVMGSTRKGDIVTVTLSPEDHKRLTTGPNPAAKEATKTAIKQAEKEAEPSE